MSDMRKNIIEQASQMMRQAGIRSVSVDDICRNLGISKKTFYVYFETKDALVEALLLRIIDKMEEDIRIKTEGKSVLDLMLNMLTIARASNDVRKAPSVLYDLKKYYPHQYDEHLTHIRALAQRTLLKYLAQG